MTEEGPILDRLTHRLAECPQDFLAEPVTGGRGEVHTAALVHDLILDLGGNWPGAAIAGSLSSKDRNGRNRLRLVSVAAWLLYDDCFRASQQYAPQALKWLQNGLEELASLVAADQFVVDADRREELARLCLAALGLRPSGESLHQAEDRMKTLDSVERIRLIKATQDQQARAKKLREEMRRKEAEEAAAKVSRE